MLRIPKICGVSFLYEKYAKQNKSTLGYMLTLTFCQMSSQVVLEISAAAVLPNLNGVVEYLAKPH